MFSILQKFVGLGLGFTLRRFSIFLENICCSLNPAVGFCFVSWFNTLVVVCSGLGFVFGFDVKSLTLLVKLNIVGFKFIRLWTLISNCFISCM